jgi:hypothetical protein
MANPIVTVNVTQTVAPTPSTLQETGAFISQGGTTLAAGNYALLTQVADLTPLLAAGLALTGIVWAASFGGQATVTTTAPHGVPVNQQFTVTIAGVQPTGYNGTFLATSTGASTFTYFLAVNPGAFSTAGTYTPPSTAELLSMATTYFAQGAQQPVYVLELGTGTVAQGVTALTNFINNSQQFFYSYLVPRSWDGNANFLAFLAGFETTTSKTYFFVTTNVQNYPLYTTLMKDVLTMVQPPVYRPWVTDNVTTVTWTTGIATATMAVAHGINPGDTFTLTGILSGTVPAGYNGTFIALPGTTGTALVYAVAVNPGTYTSGGTLLTSVYSSPGAPATEFTMASMFFVTLNYNPSTTNKVPPLAFSFLFGVTPFPTLGNKALLASLAAANINYVGTGAQGGISSTIVFNGHTMDGRPFNYWYSVDWMQINVQLNVGNAIINGSNTTINPLYYNQDGINRLQQVAINTGASAITFGLALGKTIQTSLDGPVFALALQSGTYAGQLVVNAVPFVNYTVENPSHYKIGEYDGLAMVYTPLRGFEHVIFNINVTDFVSAG